MKLYGINTPQDLNKYLNQIDWACVIKMANNKYKILDGDNNQDWETYKILKPKELLSVNAGCCWDFVNFEYNYFKNNFPQYPIKCYYIESEEWDKDQSTNHTWLTYIDKGYNVFESSWKVNIGIHHYINENDMINKYVSKQFHNYKKLPKLPKYIIYEYIPIDSVSPEEFMEYIYNTGKIIKDHNYYNTFIAPYRINNHINWNTRKNDKKG